MNSPSIQTLMTQLQARYPSAGLTSELLTIHQGSYVVRAVVQIGNTILTTGLAAATDIEQAEDRAKLRALDCLGIGSVSSLGSPQSGSYSLPSPPIFQGATDFAPSEASAPSLPTTPPLPLPTEVPDRLPVTQSDFSAKAPTIKEKVKAESATGFTPPMPEPTPEPIPEPTPEPIPELDPNLAVLSDFDYSSEYNPDYASIQFEPADEAPIEAPSEPPTAAVKLPFVEAPSEPQGLTEPVTEIDAEEPSAKSRSTSSEKAAAPRKTTKRKTEPIEAPQPSGEADRSEEIAKIGLEMKRLGWTTEQGRNYLKRTYGKRSRQELDDAELIDFLRYLEFQPSPSESPF